MPRWLCVATGTASKTRPISSSVKPSSRRRSCERSMTSSCAHGQAVMPWASTPTMRRVPVGARHGRAEERVDLLRARAGRGGELVLGIAGGDRDLGARAVLAVAHEPAMWAASVSALKASESTTSSIASFTISSKRDMCAPFCSGPRSTKHSSSA